VLKIIDAFGDGNPIAVAAAPDAGTGNDYALHTTGSGFGTSPNLELLTKQNQPTFAGGTATNYSVDLYNTRGQMLYTPWTPNSISSSYQTMRIGLDHCFNGAAAAKAYAAKTTGFFASSSAGLNGIDRILDLYTLTGGAVSGAGYKSATWDGQAVVSKVWGLRLPTCWARTSRRARTAWTTSGSTTSVLPPRSGPAKLLARASPSA